MNATVLGFLPVSLRIHSTFTFEDFLWFFPGQRPESCWRSEWCPTLRLNSPHPQYLRHGPGFHRGPHFPYYSHHNNQKSKSSYQALIYKLLWFGYICNSLFYALGTIYNLHYKSSTKQIQCALISNKRPCFLKTISSLALFFISTIYVLTFRSNN